MLPYAAAPEPGVCFTLGKQDATRRRTKSHPAPGRIPAKRPELRGFAETRGVRNKHQRPPQPLRHPLAAHARIERPQCPRCTNQNYQKSPSADRARAPIERSTALLRSLQFAPVALPQLQDNVPICTLLSSQVRAISQAVKPNDLQSQ